MATLCLNDPQVSRERRIGVFINSDSPAHIRVLRVYPCLQTSCLDVAAVDLLLSTLKLEILFCCLPVCKGGPVLGEYVMVRMFENFKFGEIAIFDNVQLHEGWAGWLLKGSQSVVLVNCITNRSTAS
jgi:hypothetical protein